MYIVIFHILQVNYGVFLDNITANILLDHFIKNEKYTGKTSPSEESVSLVVYFLLIDYKPYFSDSVNQVDFDSSLMFIPLLLELNAGV